MHGFLSVYNDCSVLTLTFAHSYMFLSPPLVSAVDEYDYTTSERGPTYEYEEKVMMMIILAILKGW